jgi:hypothetical protein
VYFFYHQKQFNLLLKTTKMELKIMKEKAVSAFKNAGTEGKALLSDLFGRDVLCQEPMAWVKTFADVCMAAGVDVADYALPVSGTYKEKAAKYMDRLMLLEVAFNGGKVPNLADITERKYYPWHNIIPDSSRPAGFRLSYYVCDYDYSLSYLGDRPAFLEKEHAEYAGTQFIEEYEAHAQYEELSNN